MLIEYDGEQHFKIKEFWGGETALLLIQKRYQIKNDYCKENNITLLRIRYDEKIKEKIISKLNEYGTFEPPLCNI